MENIYSQLEVEDRICFIGDLEEISMSDELMNTASFNCLLIFFEFLVNLLVYEKIFLILGN